MNPTDKFVEAMHELREDRGHLKCDESCSKKHFAQEPIRQAVEAFADATNFSQDADDIEQHRAALLKRVME